jgi:hypothetical protein
VFECYVLSQERLPSKERSVNLRTVLAIILLAGSALAQTPVKPGPEVKKLDYFVGTWTGEGTIPPGPWGPGGGFSVTHTHEWMVGNFFLETHSDIKMPPDLGGESKSMGLRATTPTKRCIPRPSSLAKVGAELRKAPLTVTPGLGLGLRSCQTGR